MSSFHWRVPGPFFDYDILRARDATPEQRGAALPPEEAARELAAAYHSPWSAEALGFALTHLLLEHETRRQLDDAHERLVRMLMLGAFIIVPAVHGQVQPRKKSVPPPPVPKPVKTAEITVQLLDPTRKPLGGPACVIEATGGGEHRVDHLPPSGRHHVGGIPPGACFVGFPNIHERPGGPVPAELPGVEDADGAIAVTRGDGDLRWDVGTRIEPHVFQLRRRRAEIVEIEHFHGDGAVMLPGRPPGALRSGAPIVTGIDVLKECLARAAGVPLDQMRITGHHAILAKERADGVRHLLTGDEAAWAALSNAKGREEDWRAILAWVAETKGWACAPGADGAAAVKELQRSYNAHMGGKLVVNGVVNEPVWRAFFDLYMEAIRPRPKKALASHPYIVAHYGKNFVPHIVARDANGGDARYVEMNPLNPTKPIPGDRGWYPTWPGETVWLPDDWDQYVDKLVKAGWHAYHGAPDPGPSPEPGPPALEKPGPRAVGCGAHHLATPHAKAKARRGEQRCVEVVLLSSLEQPKVLCGAGAGACDAGVCELYDPREYELCYVSLGLSALPPERRRIAIRVCDEEKRPIAGARCRLLVDGRDAGQAIASGSGWVVLSVPADAEHVHADWSRPEDAADVVPFHRDLYVALGDGDEASRRRLHNVGYSREGTLEEKVRAFQREFGRAETGLLADVAGELDAWHDGGARPAFDDGATGDVGGGEGMFLAVGISGGGGPDDADEEVTVVPLADHLEIASAKIVSARFVGDHALMTDQADFKKGGANLKELRGVDWAPGFAAPVSYTFKTRIGMRATFEVEAPIGGFLDGRIVGEIRDLGGQLLGTVEKAMRLRRGTVNADFDTGLLAPGAISTLRFRVVWRFDNKNLTSLLSPESRNHACGTSGVHEILTTLGTPVDEHIAPEDGITLRRMRAAVGLLDGFPASSPVDAHAVAFHIMSKYPGMSAAPFIEPGVGAWPLAERPGPNGECQAIVRLIRGALKQIGCPDRTDIVVLWVEPRAPNVVEEEPVDLWQFPISNPGARSGALAERTKRASSGALLHARLAAREFDETELGRRFATSAAAGLNLFEACLKLTAGGVTRYYPGGTEGMARGRGTKEEVIRAVFPQVVWVEYESATPDAGTPFVLREIIKIFDQKKP